MAKKKESADDVLSVDENERIVAEIDKQYGKGLIVSGQDIVDQKKTIIPISPSLDIITHRIVEGSWVGITGPEKLGKTVLALTIAANAQKPEYGNRTIYYGDVEGRLSRMHLSGIKGLDLSEKKFKVIKSKKGTILTTENWLDTFVNIIRTCPNIVLVIDSLSVMCDERVMQDGVGTQTRSAGYKSVSAFVDMCAPIVPINNTIIIGITRLIANTSGMGQGKTEKAASAWKYQMDYQIRGVMKQPWKVGEKRIGQIVTWVCNCSKLGPPGMKIESYLRYGIGIDKLFEIISFGKAVGLIATSGSWMSLNYLSREAYKHLLPSEGVPKVQGGEGVYQLLQSHPEWAEALEKEVIEAAGSLASGDDD